MLAADPVTGEQAAEEVTHLWVHEDELVELNTTAGTVFTTEDHPFWNETDQQWQRADELGRGDELADADGVLVTVQGFEFAATSTEIVYNLTVDRLHTYYVSSGRAQLLVHNAGQACQFSPSFVVKPNGETVIVPSGATGPIPTKSSGFQYVGGQGGHGLADNVTDVRIMDPHNNPAHPQPTG